MAVDPEAVVSSEAGDSGQADELRPFVLGIVGDSGSGKSTVSKGVRQLIGPERVAELKLDDYHRYTREERRAKGLTALNPLVHNLSLLEEHLRLLRRGRPIRNRSYEHRDGSFGPIRLIEPRDIVLARGLLGFPSEALRAYYDLAVFLLPEPELLFRWKLRRDMRTRGYSEAEVLKNIAQHLLDSKVYVVPQAERADVLVRHRLEDWEDPDSEVRTSLVVRGRAADTTEQLLRAGEFGDAVWTERVGEEYVVGLGPTLGVAQVEAWGRQLFPEAQAWERIGEHQAEEAGTARRASLAFVQVMVAGLTDRLRQQTYSEGTPAALGR